MRRAQLNFELFNPLARLSFSKYEYRYSNHCYYGNITHERAPVALNILDLTDVPYMDSMGLGMIVAHHVRCHHRGIRMVAAGVGARVLQLLKLTRVDRVFPMATTVEEAKELKGWRIYLRETQSVESDPGEIVN